MQLWHSINKIHEIEKSVSENYVQIIEEANLLFDFGFYEFALAFFEHASEFDSDDQAYIQGIERCEQAIIKAMNAERHDKK